MKTKIILGLVAVFALLLASGCQTGPIKTTLDLESTATGLPALSYSSEKDLSYERTVKDVEGGIIEHVKFTASASDPATVQAKSQADMLKYAVELGTALGANAENALTNSGQ